MYLLEAHKRNGSLWNHQNYKSIKRPGMYTVLGFFDCLSLSRMQTIEDMLKYSDNDLSERELYNRYAIPIFTFPKITKVSLLDDMLNNNIHDNHIYQLTFLKLNPQITTVFKHSNEPTEDSMSGMEFMQVVAIEALNQLQPTVNNLEFTLLGCLGSYDYLLLCRLNVKDLEDTGISPWNEMFDLSLDLRRMRYGQDKHAYFDFTYSFITYSGMLECNKNGPVCEITTQINTLHVRTNLNDLQAEIISNINSTFLSKKPDVYVNVSFVHGSDDYQIYVRAPLFRILNLFVHEGLFDVHRLIGATEKEKSQFEIFGETRSTFLHKREDDYSSPDTSHQIYSAPKLISELLDLYKETKQWIPSLLSHSMEHLLYSCKYLLYNDYHALTGIKLYKVLKDFMQRLCAHGWKSDTIGEYIMFINSVIPMSMKLQSVYFNTINDVDWVSPISKVVYAYEHFFTLLCERIRGYRKVDEYGKSVDLYVTIGNKSKIMSQEYMDIHPKRNSEHTAKLFLSFDLPSVAALDLAKTYALLIHEVGHYSMHSLRETRNKNVMVLFHSQLCSYVKQYFFNHKLDIEEGDLNQYFKFIREWLRKVLQESVDKNGIDMKNAHLRYFIYLLRTSLHSSAIFMKEAAMQNFDIIFQGNGSSVILFDLLLSALLDFAKEMPAEQLYNLVSETHADVFMISMMRYSWEEASEKLFGIFSSQDVKMMLEHEYLLRMAIDYLYCRHREIHAGTALPKDEVLAFIQKDREKLSRFRMPDTQKLFMEKVYSTAEKYYHIYKALVIYLVELTYNCDWRMKLNIDTNDLTLLFPDKTIEMGKSEKQIEFFLTHWYKEIKRRQSNLEQYI